MRKSQLARDRLLYGQGALEWDPALLAHARRIRLERGYQPLEVVHPTVYTGPERQCPHGNVMRVEIEGLAGDYCPWCLREALEGLYSGLVLAVAAALPFLTVKEAQDKMDRWVRKGRNGDEDPTTR